jgi:hypothetical protein
MGLFGTAIGVFDVLRNSRVMSFGRLLARRWG